MHILITADPVSLQMIWDYCQAKSLTMYYGRIDHDVHEIAWQIEHESCSHLDILLLLFPEQLRVLS